MDRTVPLAAARLLDFIRDTEVGTDGPAGYDVIFGHHQNKLPEPVTRMTVDELIGAQASFTKRFGSSASGGYQFMRATLQGLKSELGLRGGQIMNPDLQDRLAFHLLKRRGYEAFMAGGIDRVEFGKRLAQEWASFPVLAAVRGAHRQLVRGQSYYSGDALNKALVKPEEVEDVLEEMRQLGHAMPAPVVLPQPAAPTAPIVVPEPVLRPNLTPLEQMNKPVGGVKGGIALAAPGAVVALLLSSADWIPQAWQSGEPAVAFGLAVAYLTTQAGNFIGGYLARDKRFQ